MPYRYTEELRNCGIAELRNLDVRGAEVILIAAPIHKTKSCPIDTQKNCEIAEIAEMRNLDVRGAEVILIA